MEVLIESNKIILNQCENLKKYQASQLEFYGYNRQSNFYWKNSENIETDLLKLIDYLDEEQLIYELSKAPYQLINKSIGRKEEVFRTFEKAGKIKENQESNFDLTQFENSLDHLPRKLKKHQIRAAFHFYTLKNGANFSVPGSGKTSTVLSVYEKFRVEDKCNSLFIIGPPSCFQPWKNEFFETLGRVPSSIILSSLNKNQRLSEYYASKDTICDLYLCTFQTALNDQNEIIKLLSQSGIKIFLIIDEAHYIKQLGGSWANSILRIGKHAEFKGVLTGTPMPKSYKDLFNLFDFLWENDSPLTEQDKIQLDSWEKNKKDDEIKSLLASKIWPLFYRVKKKELGLLPAVFHDPIIVKMGEIEKAIYSSVKADIYELSQSDYFRNEEVLHKLWKGRMMRLRQAVSYPKLLNSAINDYTEKFINDSDLQLKIQDYDKLETPGKLIALNNLVLNLRKSEKKVLIWSNFIGTLELIKSHFISSGYTAELIYGKTPVRKDDAFLLSEEKTREDIRDEFLDMNSGLDILIANPAACAESISLHKSCFHAIYFDLSYNAAQYLQSLDRIHRVGGSETKTAHYYFLQYENTVDQDIMKNIEIKAKKMYEIIEQDYNIYDLNMLEEDYDDDVSAYKRLFRQE